ncbi:MAG: hypothetical protein OSA97_16265, partial [Nevskia sp.]|nr:hypothetical protein [Nevskia sp.]
DPDTDPVARTKLAEIARQLAVGHISNDQFESALPRSAEKALHDVWYYGLWPLYDDLYEHKLVGKHKLTPEGRVWVARIVLFLRSGLPYRWPRYTGFSYLPVCLISLITFGWFGRFWRRRTGGEETVWPFFSQSEFEQAKKSPVYFGGGN